MKMLLLPLFLLMSSCGDTLPGSGSINRVGETRSLLSVPETVSSFDRQNISSICNSLLQKEAILPTTVNSTHTFFTSQTDCEGKVIEAGDVDVSIQNLGDYIFRRNDNLSFVFPQVETATSGIMKDICANLSLPTLASPLRSNTEVLYFTTLAISPIDCPSRTGELCIALERAVIQGTSAQVHTQEWIRFRTNPLEAKLGFFTHRKRITKSFCGQNKSQTFTGTLK